MYRAANLWYESLELKHVLALTKGARCCREEALELKHAIAVRKEVSKEVSEEVSEEVSKEVSKEPPASRAYELNALANCLFLPVLKFS